ncbi:Myosin regulatory light chain 10 [Plecturocebus cupreus]
MFRATKNQDFHLILTTTSQEISKLKQPNSCHPYLLASYTTHAFIVDYTRRWYFIMLARLVSNSWPQVILPPQPPKVLGLQAASRGRLCLFSLTVALWLFRVSGVGDRVLLCHLGWSAVVRSQLTATSTSQRWGLVAQAGLEPLSSGNQASLVSQSTGITAMTHRAQPYGFFFEHSRQFTGRQPCEDLQPGGLFLPLQPARRGPRVASSKPNPSTLQAQCRAWNDEKHPPRLWLLGRLRWEDGLSPGVLGCSVLCRSGVRTKFGINMVTSQERGTIRLPKEG